MKHEFCLNYPRWDRASRRCSRRGTASNSVMPGSGDGHPLPRDYEERYAGEGLLETLTVITAE